MQEVDAAVMRQRRGAKPDRELPRSSGHRTESYRFGSFRSSPLSSILRATECVGGKISRWSHAGFKLNSCSSWLSPLCMVQDIRSLTARPATHSAHQ
jgi:hypothetical protein